jgi:hypothetical protein
VEHTLPTLFRLRHETNILEEISRHYSELLQVLKSARSTITWARAQRGIYRNIEEKPRMLHKLTTILTIVVAVVSVLSTVVLAAEFEGTVSAVDDKGMATIKATDGKEHKVSIAGVKAGDKVDCHIKDGKTSCHKLGPKHN